MVLDYRDRFRYVKTILFSELRDFDNGLLYSSPPEGEGAHQLGISPIRAAPEDLRLAVSAHRARGRWDLRSLYQYSMWFLIDWACTAYETFDVVTFGGHVDMARIYTQFNLNNVHCACDRAQCPPERISSPNCSRFSKRHPD